MTMRCSRTLWHPHGAGTKLVSIGRDRKCKVSQIQASQGTMWFSRVPANSCSCCGRPETDAEGIDAGIGSPGHRRPGSGGMPEKSGAAALSVQDIAEHA